MDRQHGKRGNPNLVVKWLQRPALVALCLCGCESHVVRQEVPKPIVADLENPREVHSLLSNVRDERDQLRNDQAAIQLRKQDSFLRFKHSAGDDFERLIHAERFDVSWYLAHEADFSFKLYAEELALHLAHLQLVESRLVLLESAIAEAEAAQRIRQNLEILASDLPHQHELTAKLAALADHPLNLPTSLSIDEVGNLVAGELAVAREEAIQKARTERQAILEAKRRRVESVALLDSERRAAAEAKRVRAEAERVRAAAAAQQEQRTRDVNTALKRYAEAYHRFFHGRYQDTELILNEAIRLNPTDARYFYFRGLARNRLGKSAQALDDFRAGSEAEQRSDRRVSQALERIQGMERMTIERFRP